MLLGSPGTLTLEQTDPALAAFLRVGGMLIVGGLPVIGTALAIRTALDGEASTTVRVIAVIGVAASLIPVVSIVVRGAGAWTADVANVVSEGAAAEGAGAVISEGKFGYLFGEASGNAHNVERALENASQLSRVGVYNNAEGQALLQAHFDGVVGDSSNIISSTSNQYGNFVTRQSLFAGPGGFISFQSTWQVLEGGAQRFITAIPFGGP
jgi:filamentous hemagglutinin